MCAITLTDTTPAQKPTPNPVCIPEPHSVAECGGATQSPEKTGDTQGTQEKSLFIFIVALKCLNAMMAQLHTIEKKRSPS